MFCRKCGAQIPEGSVFCVSCGSPIAQDNEPKQVPNPYQQPMAEQNVQPTTPYAQPQNPTEAAQPQYQQPYAPVQTVEQQNQYAQQQPQAFDANGQAIQYAQQAVKAPMSPEKKKKLILFGGIGAGVVVIAIVLIVIFSIVGKDPHGSCSAAVNAYFDSTLKGDVDTYISMLPPDVVSYKVKNSYSGDYEEYKESLEDNFKSSMSMLSSISNIRYEITSEKHCFDKEEITSVNKKYIDRYDAKNSISEVAKCRVKTYVSYAGLSDSTNTDTVYLIKINGKWYIDNYSITSSISSSNFN